MISLESLKLIAATLESQDVVGKLGKCEEYMDDDGNCRMCTTLQELQAEISKLEDIHENPFEVVSESEHYTTFRAKATGRTFSVPNKPIGEYWGPK